MFPLRHPLALLAVTTLAFSAACEQDVTIVRPSITDVRFQDPPTEVDILLVVDNSCSMQDEQEKLGEGFAEFVRFFEVAEVDYHIGITTTDVFNEGPGNSGELARTGDGTRVIDEDTDDPDAVFEELVNVGIEGAGSEMGLKAALAALTPPMSEGPNAGFLREEALLSVIFVSDEEDFSIGPVNSYINSLREVKGQRSRDAFNASALTGVDPDTGEPEPCGSPGVGIGADASFRYPDVANQTGGVVGSICQSEFNDIVEEMGLASSRLRDTFFMTRQADPETLEVRVNLPGTPEFDGDGTLVPPEGLEDGAVAWAYEEIPEENEFWIRFTDRGQLPPLGSKIVIRYEVP
ncbi:MAG: hypothetical protein KDA24_15420 [Deltaproteobacteria bacterium]|nr:hypothetical protein [Deltaproteobacteria bacterium]